MNTEVAICKMMVTLGFVLMSVNYYFNIKMYKDFIVTTDSRMKSVKQKVIIHRAMMILFIFGYLNVGIRNVNWSFSNYVICGILLLGSVFVFIGIQIQYSMMKIIDKEYYDMVNSLVKAIECRDKYTCGHSEHVSNLSVLIYSKMYKHKKKSNIDYIRFAGLLHDIGKIGISEDVLNKSSSLTNEEYTIMKKHPELGTYILNEMEGFSEIAEWIYMHHERVDGTGYYGVKKEYIPEEAKIIAIADTFSAMVTDRPYRKKMSYEKALSLIKGLAGNQLDEKIVNIFLLIPQNEIIDCMPYMKTNMDVIQN